MELSEILEKIGTPKAQKEFKAMQEAELEKLNAEFEDLRDQIHKLRYLEPDMLSLLKQQTEKLAKEKGFQHFAQERHFDVYHTETDLLAIKGRKVEEYLLIRASPELALPKQTIIRAAIATHFPDNYESQNMGMDLVIGSGAIGIGAGTLSSATISLLEMGLMGSACGLFAVLGIGSFLKKLHSYSSMEKGKKYLLPSISDEIEMYLGADAIKELERM